MAIEKPTYRVVRVSEGIELRDYDEYWLAECRVENVADLRDASSRAFGRLFNYISGENDQRQKIAMTAPVQTMAGENGWLVSFVVPKDVALGDIPVPTNSSLHLRKVEGGLYAALRYRGLWDSERFAEKSKQLATAIEKLGLVIAGPMQSAIYNPPLTPPPLRRNEVLVRVTERT